MAGVLRCEVFAVHSIGNPVKLTAAMLKPDSTENARAECAATPTLPNTTIVALSRTPQPPIDTGSAVTRVTIDTK